MKTAAAAGMIPVNDLNRHIRPLREGLIRAVTRVVESGWYILGPCVQEFESEFAKTCGVPFCVGTANGTDALELALRACGAGSGKRVITVANAGGYGTTAILAAGAVPAFADIDPATSLISADAIAEAVRGHDIAAILVTHLYGRMADMPAIVRIAEGANVPVIEDCAQAHGASFEGRPAGSWGAAGCFSFYPTKNLGALGDGGAVVTGDPATAQRLRHLRQYGWREKYASEIPGGRNSRLDEIQAACLLEQLPFLGAWNERRRAVARRYCDELAGCGVFVPPAGDNEYVAHLYVVRHPRRDEMRKALAARGIASDVHYPIPDHRQNAWSSQPWAGVPLPHTEAACREVLTLPCFPELADDEVLAVVSAVRECAG